MKILENHFITKDDFGADIVQVGLRRYAPTRTVSRVWLTLVHDQIASLFGFARNDKTYQNSIKNAKTCQSAKREVKYKNNGKTRVFEEVLD